MPEQNGFRHQSYPAEPAVPVIFRRLTTASAGNIDFSKLHTDLGITRVLLVHGTFMGDDPFGIAEVLQSIARNIPLLSGQVDRLADSLRERMQPLTAQLTGDIGNYTAEFACAFRDLLAGDPVVELLEPAWSSQNHHLARAELAVRLVCWLQAQNPAADDRILLWGHSHAGNAFALLSNLLANDRHAVEQFFEAAGPQASPWWQQARRILAEATSPHPFAQCLLIAAFGTPVRYGWDTRGYRSLVHVLHHRPSSDDAVASPPEEHPHLVLTRPLYPPQLISDVVNARYGDWVQAFAIAGTDVATPASLSANERLEEFLESTLPAPILSFDLKLIASPALRSLCARWKTGTRCHADGQNLLVEYESSGRTSLGAPVENSVLGHGVATTVTWLPAHLQLVMETLQAFED